MSVKMPQSLYAKSVPDPYPSYFAVSDRAAIKRVSLSPNFELKGAYDLLAREIGHSDDATRRNLDRALAFTRPKLKSMPDTPAEVPNVANTDPRVAPTATIRLLNTWQNAAQNAAVKSPSGTPDTVRENTYQTATEDLERIDAIGKLAHPEPRPELKGLPTRRPPNDSLPSFVDPAVNTPDPASRAKNTVDALVVANKLQRIIKSLKDEAARTKLLEAAGNVDRSLQQSLSQLSVQVMANDIAAANARPVQPVAMAAHPPSRTPQAAEVIADMKKAVAPVPGAPIRATSATPAVREEQSLFEQYCRAGSHSISLDDRTDVDYLALKRMMHNVVKRQNETIYRGVPAITLNSLVLTTKFQIILELQAGTQHILRIVPLIAPPNFEAKFDHAHQLKLYLSRTKAQGRSTSATEIGAELPRSGSGCLGS